MKKRLLFIAILLSNLVNAQSLCPRIENDVIYRWDGQTVRIESVPYRYVSNDPAIPVLNQRFRCPEETLPLTVRALFEAYDSRDDVGTVWNYNGVRITARSYPYAITRTFTVETIPDYYVSIYTYTNGSSYEIDFNCIDDSCNSYTSLTQDNTIPEVITALSIFVPSAYEYFSSRADDGNVFTIPGVDAIFEGRNTIYSSARVVGSNGGHIRGALDQNLNSSFIVKNNNGDTLLETVDGSTSSLNSAVRRLRLTYPAGAYTAMYGWAFDSARSVGDTYTVGRNVLTLTEIRQGSRFIFTARGKAGTLYLYPSGIIARDTSVFLTQLYSGSSISDAIEALPDDTTDIDALYTWALSNSAVYNQTYSVGGFTLTLVRVEQNFGTTLEWTFTVAGRRGSLSLYEDESPLGYGVEAYSLPNGEGTVLNYSLTDLVSAIESLPTQ